MPANPGNTPSSVKPGEFLQTGPFTTPSADLTRLNLEIGIFGDGSLPFLLETPAGSVKISWNALSGTGTIHQTGNEKYTVSKWSKSDETPMVLKGRNA